MLKDAREIDLNALLQCDLCIIGAGPTGISIAREFIGQKKKVILLESGGMNFEEKTQDLYDGKSVGLRYSLTDSRARYFGGSSNLWWGNCFPLDESDFEKRDWVPESGWPFGLKELRPFYDRAMKVIPLGTYDEYDVGRMKDRLPHPLLDFKNKDVRSRILQEAKSLRFKDLYGPELKAAEDVRCLIHANVLEIVPDTGSGYVHFLRVKTLAGNEFKVAAKAYVLAASGVENARILLNSDSVHRKGVGNQNDLVGRYFMEHPVIEGWFVPASKDVNFKLYEYHERKPVGDVNMWSMLAPAEDYLRRNRVLSAGFCFEGAISESVLELDELKRYLRGQGRGSFTAHLRKVLEDLQGVADYTYRKKRLGLERWQMESRLWLFTGLFEMAPDRENRLVLSEERDALGQRRSELRMKLSDLEKKSYVQLFDFLAHELGAENYGRVNLHFTEVEDWGIKWWDHQLGTTRMSEDPKKGVVDSNQKVHGIPNLYVAGSSVFPTAGFSSPTLTIVAMSLRLADHLKGVLSWTPERTAARFPAAVS